MPAAGASGPIAGWRRPADAVEHAMRLVEAGADVIDVGGESTRPGAERVDPDEQIGRTAPVIEAVRRRTDVAISIDTTRAAVAAAALDAGAEIVNDVSAAREDPDLTGLVARRGCGLILMHRAAPPEQDSYSDRYDRPPEYADVTGEVAAFLADRLAAVVTTGVAPDRVALDPGLGFGKTVEQNYRLIAETGRLLDLGRPLLSAASRKSFIGARAGVAEPDRRDAASVAVSVAHWLAGVRLFRVHDVAMHREALLVAAAIGEIGPGQ
ncbi:MAG: dihydropteroate synthase [Planctomycetota bacterium]|jgi:dihydropteroate synthase